MKMLISALCLCLVVGCASDPRVVHQKNWLKHLESETLEADARSTLLQLQYCVTKKAEFCKSLTREQRVVVHNYWKPNCNCLEEELGRRNVVALCTPEQMQQAQQLNDEGDNICRRMEMIAVRKKALAEESQQFEQYSKLLSYWQEQQDRQQWWDDQYRKLGAFR